MPAEKRAAQHKYQEEFKPVFLLVSLRLKVVWFSWAEVVLRGKKGKGMENIHDRDSNQFVPPTLIEFLLGDGTRPGWLDQQRISTYNALAKDGQRISE